VRIDGVWADIRHQHLLNTSLDMYDYVNQPSHGFNAAGPMRSEVCEKGLEQLSCRRPASNILGRRLTTDFRSDLTGRKSIWSYVGQIFINSIFFNLFKLFIIFIIYFLNLFTF
jgi:hypothetical protein